MMKRVRRGKAWRRWGLGIAIALGSAAGAGDIASAQGSEPKFVLSGIVIDARGAALAILEEPQLTGGRSAMFRIGDMIGPYRVAGIEPDQAVLERPGGPTVRLRLSGTPGAPPAAVAAPAPQKVLNRPPARPVSEEQRRAFESPPPGPGEPAFRPAWEGPSRPDPRPPAFEAEDFKRQIQQHLMGGSSR